MEMSRKTASFGTLQNQAPAIRQLVETALRGVISGRQKSQPRGRDEWVAHLADALMSESEAPHHAVIAALMSTGVGRRDIFQNYVPAAARYLGELWVGDKVSFVDVTVGASRLQSLFRSHPDDVARSWQGRSIPLGHSVLMVIPRFEGHSLGAFVAADSLRRHGLWTHMGIGLDGGELTEIVDSGQFSMIGITLGTPNSVEKATELIDFVRTKISHVPPIVIGGRAVEVMPDAVRRTGADHTARNAREAIEKCGLSAMVQASRCDEVC